MSLALRLTAAMFASLSGIVAILLILWPGWILAARQGGSLLPWQSGSWSLLLVDAAGRTGVPAQQSALLAAITLLLAITLVSTSLSVIGPDRRAAEASPVRADPAPSGGEINAEMAKVVALLRAHLEANGLYDAVLAKANAQLPSLVKPEQIRMIVSYLMVENENMRNRSRNLQNNLEQSRQQIEYLKSNLAFAKAEGMSDSLTSLKNRRSFDLTLASEIAEARSTSRPLSLILADIDGFKAVNDRLGHQAGDDVLKSFAKILAANMEGRDTVARFGGEEFAIILPQRRIENAASLAGQIRTQVESTGWHIPGAPQENLKITASFVVAEMAEGEGTDALIKRADAKLYDAKMAGRNAVKF